MKEKKYREMCLLKEIGTDNISLHTKMGETIALGYDRVVFGKRGPYVEFDKYQIQEKKLYIPTNQLYRLSDPKVFYVEFRSLDQSNTMVYYQLRNVAYADYKIGYFYVSLFDLYTYTGELCAKTLDLNLEIAQNFFEFDNKE